MMQYGEMLDTFSEKWNNDEMRSGTERGETWDREVRSGTERGET